MHCQDIQDRLDEYRERSLAPDAMAQVAKHLATCANCAAAFAADESLGELLRGAEAPSPAASYFDTLPSRIRERLERATVQDIPEALAPPPATRHRYLARLLEVAAAFVIGAACMHLFNALPERPAARRAAGSAGANERGATVLASAIEAYRVDERPVVGDLSDINQEKAAAGRARGVARAAPAAATPAPAPAKEAKRETALGTTLAPAAQVVADAANVLSREELEAPSSTPPMLYAPANGTVSAGDIVRADSQRPQAQSRRSSPAVVADEEGSRLRPSVQSPASAPPAAAAPSEAQPASPGTPARKMVLGGLANTAGTEKDKSSPMDNRAAANAPGANLESDNTKEPAAGIPAQALAKDTQQLQTQWYARELQTAHLAPPASAAKLQEGIATSTALNFEAGRAAGMPMQSAELDAFGATPPATASGQWDLLIDAEDAALAGDLTLALSIFDRIARANPDSRIALRAQVRIGEIAQEKLKDTARARAAFEACLAPPLNRHLSPDLKREIERRLAELPQPR